MTALAGLFLIAHGLVHLAIWLPEPKADAPFDPLHSWLFRDGDRPVRALAVSACVMLVAAGVLVLTGAGLGAGLAVAGAALSLVLVVATFHPWLLGAVAINTAIVAVGLT